MPPGSVNKRTRPEHSTAGTSFPATLLPSSVTTFVVA